MPAIPRALIKPSRTQVIIDERGAAIAEVI